MSDEEEGWMEEEEKAPVKKDEPAEQKTEAQLLIEAKLKKHEDEDMAKLREIEEQRRIQREKEDEELRRLKEKQAQRKKEREEEERQLEEQKRINEEARRREEEERKQKSEEEKRRKLEEVERKKAAAAAAMSGGRNFVIKDKSNEGESTIDKFMSISKAKAEMGLNSGELEALKKRTMVERIKPLSVEGLSAVELKAKAEDLWKQIIQLETAMYDLDERAKRQEYDLRELNERQRQINQKKYMAAGLNPEANMRYPPKVQIVSKHERRVDRRTFGDKRGLFDSPKKEEEKPFLKPVAKKRDTWIKEKTEEHKRRSYDALDEDNAGTHHEQEEEDFFASKQKESNEVGQEDEEEE